MKKLIIPAILGFCVLSIAYAKPFSSQNFVAGEVLVKVKPGTLKSLTKSSLFRGQRSSNAWSW